MPRRINREEFQKLGSRPIGKKHEVRVAIENMPKGELLHITRSEFTWKKCTPFFFINQIAKTTGKKFVLVETKNRLGWVVERTE